MVRSTNFGYDIVIKTPRRKREVGKAKTKKDVSVLNSLGIVTKKEKKREQS